MAFTYVPKFFLPSIVPSIQAVLTQLCMAWSRTLLFPWKKGIIASRLIGGWTCHVVQYQRDLRYLLVLLKEKGGIFSPTFLKWFMLYFSVRKGKGRKDAIEYGVVAAYQAGGGGGFQGGVGLDFE